MSNKKQSSVEWYADEEHNLFISYQKGFMSTARYILLKHNLQKQAKEMHKDEISKSLDVGYQIANEDVRFKHIQSSDQYYNETFGGSHE